MSAVHNELIADVVDRMAWLGPRHRNAGTTQMLLAGRLNKRAGIPQLILSDRYNVYVAQCSAR